MGRDPDVSEAGRRAEGVDDLARGLGDVGCVPDYPAALLVVPVTVEVARATELVGVRFEGVKDRVREAVPTQRAANLIVLNVGVPTPTGFPHVRAWDAEVMCAWYRSGSVRWLSLTAYAP